MWFKINEFKYVIFMFIFQIVYVNSVSDFESSKLPLWTWECLDSRCVPSTASDSEKIQSLEMCNMLCSTTQLWPYPTGPVKLSSSAVPVRADLIRLRKVVAPTKSVHNHLEDAFDLFNRDLRYLEANAVGSRKWRSIAVYMTVNESGDPRLRMNTDESYSLTVTPRYNENGDLFAKIYAKSFCGARHALETLQQLIWFDPVEGTLYVIEDAKIEDKPRFSYRGLLLDTGHSFITVPDIISTIDAMAASKLNTFHWHISDSESFPFKSESVPKLSQLGILRKGLEYTTEDISKIVGRARLRGIRVMIEIDTPAHVGCSWSWGKASDLGDLDLCANLSNWKEFCQNPPCGQLNPMNPHVYELLERLYTEIYQLTGLDDIFHIGGDDVSFNCLKKHFPDRDANDLLKEYTQNVLDRIQKVNGVMPNLTIMWASPLSERLETDFSSIADHLGLQSRSKEGETAKIYSDKIRVIISHKDPWDLNSGMGEWYDDSETRVFNSWQRMYEYRPWVRKSRGSVIIGGEMTVWGAAEGSRVWPRAAAVAERLWSDRPEGATRAVHARLDVQRQRLTARGINAAPMWSMWCSHYTHTCG